MEVVHRLWLGGEQPPLEPWLGNVIRNLNPDVEVHDWRASHLPDECRSLMDELQNRACPEDAVRHASNVARWWLLGQHGGVWMDYDFVPLLPLDDLPRFVSAAHGATRCPCFVRVPRGEPFPGEVLDSIRRLDPSATRECKAASGDLALTYHAPMQMGRMQLPFGSTGKPFPAARPWGVHLFSTSGR